MMTLWRAIKSPRRCQTDEFDVIEPIIENNMNNWMGAFIMTDLNINNTNKNFRYDEQSQASIVSEIIKVTEKDFNLNMDIF